MNEVAESVGQAANSMISIVTPSYNQPDWLRLAVASVADQRDVEVEHIVQDAGTPGLEESSRKEFGPLLACGRLRLSVEKDAGMYDAVNRGLERARGEICAYLNCDEQYLPGSLAAVDRFFAAHPSIDVLFGDLVIVDRQGTPLSYRRTILPTQAHLRAAHLNTTSCATFFRRKLWTGGLRFDPQWKAIGDGVWVDRLLEHRVPMGLLPEPLAVFTMTGNNLGATAASSAEAARWRRALGMGGRFATLRTVVMHRLRKALAGAYGKRAVTVAVHTLASPNRRVTITASRVGSGWPSGKF